MGATESKPTRQVSHEQIVNLINTNSETNVHAEKSATALMIIAYIAILLVIATGLYFTNRLISSYERMRGQARIDNAIGLRSVRTTVA